MTPPKIVPNAFVSFGSIVMRIAGKRSSISPQKRVVATFVADSCRRAVTGDDDRVVVERHEFPVNRGENIRSRSTSKVRSADALLEKGISREQNILSIRQQEARASRSVPRRVDHAK